MDIVRLTPLLLQLRVRAQLRLLAGRAAVASGGGGGRAVRHHRHLPRRHGEVLLVLLRQQEVGTAIIKITT